MQYFKKPFNFSAWPFHSQGTWNLHCCELHASVNVNSSDFVHCGGQGASKIKQLAWLRLRFRIVRRIATMPENAKGWELPPADTANFTDLMSKRIRWSVLPFKFWFSRVLARLMGTRDKEQVARNGISMVVVAGTSESAPPTASMSWAVQLGQCRCEQVP